MKKLIILILLLSMAACASVVPLRSHETRRYSIEYPYLTFNYCAKYKWLTWVKNSKRCKTWKIIKVDMRNEKDMKEKFGNGWIVISEGRVL